ncbi:MAG: cyclase family protein [Cyclobacteriaceae bacterium]|nr:cyclase family protein [Cyclobacteriaceae bacterium]
MIIEVTSDSKRYSANLHEPLDISLPIQEGEKNPNCYWAGPVAFETIRDENFIGSVKDGGTVNYQKLTITPHGNGTHTECYGHISADGATLNKSLNQFHFLAEVITVTPEKNHQEDSVITRKMIEEKIHFIDTQALVVRTLANDDSKKSRSYSGTNPPYIEAEGIEMIVSLGIQHILIDLPSLDKEVDGGNLLAHKAFWRFPKGIRKGSTVTELIYVDNSIEDGLYFLNLQITSLEMDASPSKPVLYKLKEVL